MKEFILIVVCYTYGYINPEQNVVTFQAFSSSESCIAARDFVKTHAHIVNAYCIPECKYVVNGKCVDDQVSTYTGDGIASQ